MGRTIRYETETAKDYPRMIVIERFEQDHWRIIRTLRGRSRAKAERIMQNMRYTDGDILRMVQG